MRFADSVAILEARQDLGVQLAVSSVLFEADLRRSGLFENAEARQITEAFSWLWRWISRSAAPEIAKAERSAITDRPGSKPKPIPAMQRQGVSLDMSPDAAWRKLALQVRDAGRDAEREVKNAIASGELVPEQVPELRKAAKEHGEAIADAFYKRFIRGSLGVGGWIGRKLLSVFTWGATGPVFSKSARGSGTIERMYTDHMKHWVEVIMVSLGLSAGAAFFSVPIKIAATLGYPSLVFGGMSFYFFLVALVERRMQAERDFIKKWKSAGPSFKAQVDPKTGKVIAKPSKKKGKKGRKKKKRGFFGR